MGRAKRGAVTAELIDARRLFSTSNPVPTSGRSKRYAHEDLFAGKVIPTGPLTDAMYVSLVKEFGLNKRLASLSNKIPREMALIASGGIIWDTKSSRSKQYQGYIGVLDRKFYAVFVHGGSNAPHANSSIKPATSLLNAIEVMNNQMRNKLAGKSSSSIYTLKPGELEATLGATDVELQFKAKLAKAAASA